MIVEVELKDRTHFDMDRISSWQGDLGSFKALIDFKVVIWTNSTKRAASKNAGEQQEELEKTRSDLASYFKYGKNGVQVFLEKKPKGKRRKDRQTARS